MKKNVWLLGMAVAALTSCTQSEVVDIPESRVIDFETFVDKPTRASDDVIDSESAKFREFYVYAAKGTKTTPEAAITFDSDLVLDQQLVEGGRGSWSYEPHATWVSENYYRFAAYANGNVDGSSANQAKLDGKVAFKKGTTLGAQDWGLTFNDYQVAEGKDLVVAIADEKYTGSLATDPGSVALNFKHILSKVEFRFYYTPTVPDQYLEIESFGFDAATTGDCETHYTGSESLIGATWTPAIFTRNDEDGFDYTYFDGPDPDGKLPSGNIHEAHYVIPQPTTSLVVPKITIKTMNAEGEVQSEQSFTNVSLAVTTPGHTSWLPGYVYRYEATLSGKLHEIHFTTSVKNWDSTLPVLPVQ